MAPQTVYQVNRRGFFRVLGGLVSTLALGMERIADVVSTAFIAPAHLRYVSITEWDEILRDTYGPALREQFARQVEFFNGAQWR